MTTADERWAIEILFNIVTERWDRVDSLKFDELKHRIKKVNMDDACIEFDTFILKISDLEEHKEKERIIDRLKK